MFIKNITISGFMPFRDSFTVSFEKGQIIAVTGQYGNDTTKSNRAGKSSFFDAISWIIYGESRAKKEIELIHDEAQETRGTITLQMNNAQEFSITRWRDKENKGGVEVTDLAGSNKKVSQKDIDKKIGLTYEEFLFTAFFKQDDIDQFMKADPQKKKSILMNWIQTNNWHIYEERASNFRKQLQTAKDDIQSKIDGLPEEVTNIDSLHSILKNIDNMEKPKWLKDIEDNSKQILTINLQLEKLKEVDSLRDSIQKLDREIQALKNQRSDSEVLHNKKAKLEENLKKYPVITDQKFEEAQQARTKHTTTLADYRTQYANIQKQLKTSKEKMTGICPITNESCEKVALSPEQIQQWEITLKTLENNAAKINDVLKKCENITKLKQEQIVWQKDLDILLEKEKLGIDVEKIIAEKQDIRSEILASIPKDTEKKKQELITARTSLENNSRKCQQEVQLLDRRVGEIEQSIKQHGIRKEKLAAYNLQLNLINQQLADCKWVEYMFGKNGIPSIELENSFQEIENDANLFLKNLQAPFHIEFEAMRDLKDWEPSCLACDTTFEKGERTHICKKCGTPRQKKRRDELSLKMFEGTQERPYYLDSGGGQILQAISIRLALTLLARRRNGSGWGTLILDELFGKLDPTNKQLVSELIINTLQSLGFEQIFVISHDANIQSSISNQLIIERNQEQNYSNIIY